MGIQTRVSDPIYILLPTEVAGFDPLAELALGMRWPWNHAADELWMEVGGKDHLLGTKETLEQVLLPPDSLI